MLNLKINGFDAIDLSLGGVYDSLQVQEILDLATATALSRIRQRFQLMVSPDGTPWVPSKAALKEGRNTLIDTGRLYNSIQLSRVGIDHRVIGTDVPYALQHNNGIGQVQREFMGLNEDDVSLIFQIIEARIIL